ncbi:protein RER1 isoform X2 [Dermacentor variabilis]|uniref:protein RER1 isoform X2 n=1 Tax=Dermacentor variabilis TaxID=34621 RepID=UPI003F5BEAB7
MNKRRHGAVVESGSSGRPPAARHDGRWRRGPAVLLGRVLQARRSELPADAGRVDTVHIGTVAGAVLLLVAFLGRILYLQGWYIITYALGIYHLNLFIAFLTPKVDPALGTDDYEDGPELPTKVNEEFRPFIRRLPEFKFWYSATKATLVAIACTFFDAFNVPVFWPILLLYFITLFCLTMKRQIKHMLKYRYLPWTHGKTQYRARDMASGPLNVQEL